MPSKLEAIPISIILFLPPVAVIGMMGTKAPGFWGCVTIIAMYLLLFGFFLLKDYKNLYLDNDILEIKYTFCQFEKLSDRFLLENIVEFKVVKYSLQVMLPTVVYLSYQTNYGIRVKKISMKIDGSKKIFQLFLDELSNKGVAVVIEGDYWR